MGYYEDSSFPSCLFHYSTRIIIILVYTSQYAHKLYASESLTALVILMHAQNC